MNCPLIKELSITFLLKSVMNGFESLNPYLLSYQGVSVQLWHVRCYCLIQKIHRRYLYLLLSSGIFQDFGQYDSQKNRLVKIQIWCLRKKNLVYFTTRVPDTSDTCTTRVQQEPRETQVQHKRGPNAKRKRHKKNLILWMEGWTFLAFKLKVICLNGIDYRSTS